MTVDPRIVKIKVGSHLYGCATPASDIDYKEVTFQSLEELLFSKAETNKSDTRELDNTESQAFSLRYFIKLLLGGQVIPMDMLFAPDQFIEHSTPTWEYIRENKDRFTSRMVAPFVGYAKGQAMKYGLKGSKINTLDMAIELLEANEPFDKICDTLRGFEAVEFNVENASGTMIRHIVICGKSFGETTAYSFWLKPLRQMRNTFGKRAEACIDTGTDLKAQYHTVRICKEAEELLLTGNITFPRPEAELLLRIRSGSITIQELQLLVEDSFAAVKAAELVTKLPEHPDYDFAKELVYNEQAAYIAKLL